MRTEETLSATTAPPVKRRRHLRGSLRKEGRTWVLRYPGEDRREQRMIVGTTRDFPTEKAARIAADRRMAIINPAMAVGARSITVKQMASIYIEDAIANMKPTASKAAKSLLLAHVVPVLGHLQLEAVQGRWPQVLVNAMHAKQLSNKTIDNALVIVSRMMVLARRYGYPCADFRRSMIKMPPAQVATPRRFYTPAEATQIIQGAPWPWGVLFTLYAHTGIRPGEGLGLKWPHINFASRLIQIKEAAVEGHMQTVKSHRSRADLPLSSPVAQMLIDYQQVWIPNELKLLFANEEGQPWNGDWVRHNVMRPLLKRLGLPHGALHAFRHGHVTNLLNEGIAISTVQSIARHSDIRTTAGYSHTVVDDQRVAHDRISALLPVGETRRTAVEQTLQNKANPS